MTNFRITVRGDDVELRGFVSDLGNVQALADAVKPFGWMVVASAADDQMQPPITLFHHEWQRNSG